MLKKRNVKVIIILIVLLFNPITLYILNVSYTYQKNSKNILTKVPYINVQILPNEQITNEKISYKVIKLIDMPKDIYRDINDFIGKCTNDSVTLSKGDYIKIGQIKECKNNN